MKQTRKHKAATTPQPGAPPAEAPAPPLSLWRSREALIAALLLVAIAAVYAQTAWFELLAYDDGLYLTNNTNTNQGLTWEGLRSAFTDGLVLLWIPITSISYMLGSQLYGLSAAGHHLTNVALHAVNAVLVLLVLQRLTRSLWIAAVVAGLFALHPVQVEPVAWVSGRKDVLSTTFWFLALWAYLRYCSVPRGTRLVLAWGLFALGVASKVTVIMLPAVLLVLDWQPLQRWGGAGKAGKLLAEKLPMFAFAAFATGMAVYLHEEAANVRGLEEVPLLVRGMNALYVYAFFVIKLFVPTGLIGRYPYLLGGPPLVVVAGAAILLIGISAVCWGQRRARPLLLVGWLWYVLGLLPSAGLTRPASFLMADRYVYVPMIGLYLMLGVLAAELAAKAPRRARILAGVLAALLAVLAVGSFVQARSWRTELALWDRARFYYPEDALIENGYAAALVALGREEEARPIMEAALPNAGEYAFTLNCNLANVAMLQQDYAKALGYLKAAIKQKPSHWEAHVLLHQVLDRAAADAKDEAAKATLQHEARVAQLQAMLVAGNDIPKVTGGGPDYEQAEACEHLAMAFEGKQMHEDALYLLSKARAADPTNPRYPYLGGKVFLAQGDVRKAEECFRAALSIDAAYAPAKEELSKLGLASP